MRHNRLKSVSVWHIQNRFISTSFYNRIKLKRKDFINIFYLIETYFPCNISSLQQAPKTIRRDCQIEDPPMHKTLHNIKRMTNL